jgi:cobalt-zinc-cadmium efflux system membrane fusion protein
MRRIIFLVALSAVWTFVSCGNEIVDPVVISGVPPTLQGDTIGVESIDLTVTQLNELDLESISTELKEVDFDIVTQAVAVALPGNEAEVSSPIDGRIVRIHRALGSRVNQGEPLVSLQSLTYANMLGDHIQAKAELAFQDAQHRRAKALNEQEITSISTLERSESELQRARAVYMASVANLKALGMSEAEIGKLSEREDTDPILTINAPITGQIAEIQAPVGAAINANVPLLHILDGSLVMVRCMLNPADQQYVKKGSSITLLRNGQETGLNGKVSEILPELDPDSRSIVALATVSTNDLWPRPGERFQVALSTGGLGQRRISVPESAVMVDGQNDVVFTLVGDSTVVKKSISIYRREGGNVWLDGGLDEGERVVINQLFTIKALFRVSQYSEE